MDEGRPVSYEALPKGADFHGFNQAAAGAAPGASTTYIMDQPVPAGDRIELAEFESQEELREWLKKKAPEFARTK